VRRGERLAAENLAIAAEIGFLRCVLVLLYTTDFPEEVARVQCCVQGNL